MLKLDRQSKWLLRCIDVLGDTILVVSNAYIMVVHAYAWGNGNGEFEQLVQFSAPKAPHIHVQIEDSQY